jgi:hypothetical protein
MIVGRNTGIEEKATLQLKYMACKVSDCSSSRDILTAVRYDLGSFTVSTISDNLMECLPVFPSLWFSRSSSAAALDTFPRSLCTASMRSRLVRNHADPGESATWR